MSDRQVLVYSDSLAWGIIPGTRRRFPFQQRWPGVLELALRERQCAVRVIEDCLNGRTTAFDDPQKPGRNGLEGLEQRIELNSPLSLVILMLGTNDFQAIYQGNVRSSVQGLTSLVGAVRSAPIEPDMPTPEILIVSPPPIEDA